jgi:glycosyltransferase involved in cell wall biosynthesis
MTKHKPKFSIVTICYNAENTIGNTIESVLTQDFNDLEYIFVDGRSTDKTNTIINEYSYRLIKKGIKVIHISEKDNGIYDALNKGTELASGEWITFMHADDQFCSKDVFAKVYSTVLDNVDAVYGDTIYFDDTSKILSKAGTVDCLIYRKPFYHQSSFVKTEHQKRLKFDIKYKISADFDFFQKLYLERKKIVKIDVPIALSSNTGISKSPRNAKLVYKDDFNVIKNNNISYFKHPYLILYRIKRYKWMIKSLKQTHNY